MQRKHQPLTDKAIALLKYINKRLTQTTGETNSVTLEQLYKHFKVVKHTMKERLERLVDRKLIKVNSNFDVIDIYDLPMFQSKTKSK